MGLRLLILGANGQLGHALSTHAKPALLECLDAVVCTNKSKLDLTQPDQIVETLNDFRPHVIINAAAYTEVDAAQDNAELATAINATAVGILAEQAKKIDAVLVHYSTDYVFDGKKTTSYIETDATSPLNVYGQSKLQGEQFLNQVGGKWVCFRTGWVYAQKGNNFCKKILALAKTKDSLQIVNDQHGAPTPASWLAELGLSVAGVVAKSKHVTRQNLAPSFLPDYPQELPTGEIFHATAAGKTTWYEYANFAIGLAYENKLLIDQPKLVPVDTATMSFKAPRPLYSVLDNTKLMDAFRITPPNWQKGLQQLVMSLDDLSLN